MSGGCSVLQRMLRRNPLAALSLQQPSMRTPSLSLPDDMPFHLDKEGEAESPDGVCVCVCVCVCPPFQPPPPLSPQILDQGVGFRCITSCHSMRMRLCTFAAALLMLVTCMEPPPPHTSIMVVQVCTFPLCWFASSWSVTSIHSRVYLFNAACLQHLILSEMRLFSVSSSSFFPTIFGLSFFQSLSVLKN